MLWNRTDPDTGEVGRGRLQRDGKVWVAERVTQADQGNYTIRDDSGKVLSRSTLTVHGEQSALLSRGTNYKAECGEFCFGCLT